MPMDIRNKPKYESPQVFRFGDLARGEGADCQSGSGATSDCHSGTHATAECATGQFYVQAECQDGSFARLKCGTGTSGPAT
jgi:hypothetical protein